MKRTSITLSALVFASLGATSLAQSNYTSFTGPTGEEWSRMGTDGTDLYFTTNGSELHRYSFPAGSPAGGTWTQLSSAPKTIDGWDSYRGLAHQSGFLYATALTTPFGRTILRYEIATDTWTEWGGGNSCNSSGNGMFMHPTNPGVGYSVWHAGNNWVEFDWNTGIANNSWMSTAGMLGVPDDHWTCRCDEAVYDGVGLYYGVKNDWTAGLSAGDVVYTFDINGSAGAITLLTQKAFQTGCGTTIEFVPVGHALNTTGNDEMWMYRGGDGLSASHEGWSTAGSQDLAILDLTTLAWATYTTPFFQGNGTDSVMIGDYIFVKSCGDATSPTVYDDLFHVTAGSTPGTPFCFGHIAQGNPCPCGNDNDQSDPAGAGCAHDDSAAGARLYASGTASITADTLLLEGIRGPISNSTLFFQANNSQDGNGLFLGDGIRCAGGGLIRLKVKLTDASGYANSSPSAIAARSASFGHTISAGETLYYQWWFRDSSGSPCGTESNTSNGYMITWLP